MMIQLDLFTSEEVNEKLVEIMRIYAWMEQKEWRRCDGKVFPGMVLHD